MLYQLSYSRVKGTMTSSQLLSRLRVKCGESRIRTYEAVKQQIYSLPPLATWVSPLVPFTEPTGGFEPPTC
jgi:hypothetical protein